jgi:hypothetical protein
MPDIDILGHMGYLRLGWVALALACLPRIALASAHRVALLEAADNQVPRGETAGLRADMEDVMRSLGAEIVPFDDTKTAAKGDCREPACMKAIQRSTSASHVLRVEMSFKRGSFNLQLQMWDATSGQALSSDGKACDVCTLSDLHAAVRERVGLLATRVFQAESQGAETAPTQASIPLPPAPEPAAAPLPAPPSPPPTPGRSAGERTGQIAGLALAALGVAAAAYGGYLLHLNGQRVCRDGETSPCAYHHVTGGRGAGWLLGGMGALFAGGILFYTFTW